jgi:uncharacterized tellurite resistance protein B-like protein
MGIADLSNVLRIFGGGEPTAEEKKELFKEVLLMTLSRASSSDANIHPCEVTTVQAILQRVLGEEISTADIRVAAASELYETAPLEKYLAGVARKLDPQDRVTTAQALAEVIKVDAGITSREIKFFDMVAGALQVTPSELVGLIPAH